MDRRSFIKSTAAVALAAVVPVSAAAAAAPWTRTITCRLNKRPDMWLVHYIMPCANGTEFEWATLFCTKPDAAYLSRLDGIARLVFQRAGVL